MADRLVPGPVKDIVLQQINSGDGKIHVVQVIDIKKIGSQNGGGGERYRLVVSDTAHYCQAMLATQLNSSVTNKEIEKNCLIGIKECLCNSVNGRKIAIILALEVLSPPLPDKIGDPANSEDIGDPSAAPTVERQSNASSAPSFVPQQDVAPKHEVFSPGHAKPQRLFEDNQGENKSFDNQQNLNQNQQQPARVKDDYRAGNANAPIYDSGAQGGRREDSFGGGGVGGGGGGNYGNGGQGNRYGQSQGGFNNQRGNSNSGGGFQGNNGGGGQNGGYNNGGGGGYAQDRFSGHGGGGGGNGYGGGGGGGGGYGGDRYGRGSGSGAMERNMGSGPPVEISALTPYLNGWSIQGRLTVKSAMRTYKNARGEGRLFNIDLMDSTGDIRGTFFNDDADKWFKILTTNKVYKVRGGTIKGANPQYNQTRSDFEITFNRDTAFEMLPDTEAPAVRYNFRTIQDIESTDPNTTIDVLAVVQDAAPISQVVVKSGANAGNTINKRDVVLVDQGNRTIKLTLWDDFKDHVNENQHNNPVIAIKGVRVSDFGGRSLSTTRSSMVELNPDIQEAHAMKGWYDMQGQSANFQSLSGSMGGSGKDPRKTCAAIKDEGLGHKEKPDYFTLRGWVTYFKHDGTWNYAANPETKKKVVQQGDQWFDEAQERIIDKCERRYVLSLSCSDHTGSGWFSAFDDQGRALLGISADELQDHKDSGNSEFEGTFQKAIFRPYIFKARAKMERWQDEERVKCTLMEVNPLDWKAGSQEIRDLMRSQFGL